MEKLKLYSVYHIGSGPCWQLRVAKNTEEALMQCFGTGDHAKIKDSQSSCRVEEINIPGYKIVVTPTE